MKVSDRMNAKILHLANLLDFGQWVWTKSTLAAQKTQFF